MTLEKARSIEAELQTLATVEDDPKQKNILEKLYITFTNITVEPVMVLYILPSVMASIAIQNLNLEKACRVNLKLDEEICDGLAARNTSMYNSSDEVMVQKLVASMYAWKTMIQSIIPATLLMFLGSWSDRHNRRKPCILIPILGESVTCIGFLICTYFFYELPMEFNGLSEALPPALTGGWFAMFMGVFSYISGISSVETRTIRIGAVNMFSNVSLTIGIALSGILYRTIGFYGVFSVALVMYMIGITYGFLRIKEQSNAENHIGEKEGKDVGFLKDFFNLQHISDTFKVAFKEGEKNRKKRICVIMILVMVIIGPMHGELGVMYLFTRYRFQWNEIDYSIYSTYTFVLHMFGTLFSLAFFSKFLKMDDALLGVISSSSKVLSCFVYAFAPTSTIFYLGALVEMLNGTSFIAMRSIMSKLVPADELGKINSLFGVSEALMPLVYGPMYSMVYKMTIKVLPGTFFLLGGILTFPAILIFFWLYLEHRRDAKEEKQNSAQKQTLLEEINLKTTASKSSSDNLLGNIAAPPSPTAPPSSVNCQICGRMFGKKSIKIHEPQCLKKWQQENETLPPGKRQTLPVKQESSPTRSPEPRTPQQEEKVTTPTSQKKPTMFPCYLCGRLFGVSSIYIHEPQCLKKWKIENEKLPPNKRRPEPLKPEIKFTPEGKIDYDAMNDVNWQTHLNQLVPCNVCGRTFNPDRVEVHERSCKG